MAGRFLLDTNAVIAFVADDEALRFKIIDADEVFVSITVLGELYYGAAKSSRVEENLAVVDRFARGCAVLLCTGPTARIYGHLKAALKAKGTPIPENDLWIAAVATENDLTLVTRDEHFQHIAHRGPPVPFFGARSVFERNPTLLEVECQDGVPEKVQTQEPIRFQVVVKGTGGDPEATEWTAEHLELGRLHVVPLLNAAGAPVPGRPEATALIEPNLLGDAPFQDGL